MVNNFNAMEPVELNEFLRSRSYLQGFAYSYADATLSKNVAKNTKKYDQCPHVQRWFTHVSKLNVPAKSLVSPRAITNDNKAIVTEITKAKSLTNSGKSV